MEPRAMINSMDKRFALFGYFFAMSNRLQTVGDRFYEEITCKQFFLMICLRLFENGAPTINELSEIMGCSHQNVKSIAGKLEEKGYLEIRPDSDDARKLRIRLTNKADSLAKKYQKKELDFIDMLFTGISDKQIETTFKTLEKMEENINE
ncbi:DNA-binding transcriptional regulator, MarR family [Ruminococcaceae bacterium YAD3003]|nr:DNA-binding transcriptional regulator, MarR family [Ruminococcaceae bacterium YAD3003]